MIVCSCSGINERTVLEACNRLRAGGGDNRPTPARVYKELGLRMKCGSCMRLITEIIHDGRAGSPDGT